ncbi:glucose-1-phosphate thymidylyltransferase [Methanocrinis sp.]|uniref:glucose-1-phosphate thymidylyltransferase n=1 Tax=Methanocrinis sp. TaxID=3101522 RepID=UPI003D1443E8
MKALILSGGHGTRLRPITHSQQKQLIPIANKPVLFYAMEDVIEAGAEEVGVIVGPNKDQIVETVRSRDWDAKVEFIFQGEPAGLAHTILVAEDFLGEDEFVMYLGDNVIKGGITRHSSIFRDLGPDSLVLLTEVNEPQRFGVADLDEEGRVKRLVEKPQIPPSNYALVGIYFFKPLIIEACKSIEPSWRGELEITDAIQWLIDNGHRVEASIVDGWWKDTGKSEDILEANRLILDEIEPKNEGEVKGSRIFGRAVIGEGCIIESSTIKGPCILGDGCRIRESYIGPYTAINRNCDIEGTEIEDSVVMEECSISNAGRITESLIGKNVKIRESGRRPAGHRLIVGDNSEILL